MGLILDSSVVIFAERNKQSVSDFLAHVTSTTRDQDAALSAIGLTELVHGMYRANSPQIRIRRQEFMKALLEAVTVYPYTDRTAMLAGQIDGEQTAQGVIIPFPDLLIGATALSLGFSILTRNLRHFQMIPGLNVLQG